jgi:hypothetical protein
MLGLFCRERQVTDVTASRFEQEPVTFVIWSLVGERNIFKAVQTTLRFPEQVSDQEGSS